MPPTHKSGFSPARPCAGSRLLQRIPARSSPSPRGDWRGCGGSAATASPRRSCPPASKSRRIPRPQRLLGFPYAEQAGPPNAADPRNARPCQGRMDASRAGAERCFGTDMHHKALSQKRFIPVWGSAQLFFFRVIWRITPLSLF